MNFMGPKASNMASVMTIMRKIVPSFDVAKAHWTWQQRSKELSAVSFETRDREN